MYSARQDENSVECSGAVEHRLGRSLESLFSPGRTYSRSLMLFYTGSEAELRRHVLVTYPHSTVVRY